MSQRSFGVVAVLAARDCAPEMEGRSSSPRACAGMARHPVGGGRCGVHSGHGTSRPVLFAENLSAAIGRVSLGLTGRTGDHLN